MYNRYEIGNLSPSIENVIDRINYSYNLYINEENRGRQITLKRLTDTQATILRKMFEQKYNPKIFPYDTPIHESDFVLHALKVHVPYFIRTPYREYNQRIAGEGITIKPGVVNFLYEDILTCLFVHPVSEEEFSGAFLVGAEKNGLHQFSTELRRVFMPLEGAVIEDPNKQR